MRLLASLVTLSLVLACAACGGSSPATTSAPQIRTDTVGLRALVPVVPADSVVAWSEQVVGKGGRLPAPSKVVLRARVTLTTGGLQKLQNEFAWHSQPAATGGEIISDVGVSTGAESLLPVDGWMSSTTCDRAVVDASTYHEVVVLFHPATATLVVSGEKD